MWTKLMWQPGKTTWINLNMLQRIDYRPNKYVRVRFNDGNSMTLTNQDTQPQKVNTEYDCLVRIINHPVPIEHL